MLSKLLGSDIIWESYEKNIVTCIYMHNADIYKTSMRVCEKSVRDGEKPIAYSNSAPQIHYRTHKNFQSSHPSLHSVILM